MSWTTLGIGAGILALVAYIWYNVKQIGKKDAEAEALDEVVKDLIKRLEVSNAAMLAKEENVRKEELEDAQDIVKRGDARAAGKLLADSFKSDHQ
jgi:uncharacterized protein YfkK (UPF0435 family)